MTATTSLKLPEALKSQIAHMASLEGKTAHALMVEKLQEAMEQSALRQQFYQDGVAAYEEVVKTNVCYDGDEVFAWMRAKVRGDAPVWPQAKPYRADKTVKATATQTTTRTRKVAK